MVAATDDTTLPLFVFDRRAVLVRPAETLVIADVHLGRDWASEVDLPMGERDDVLGRLSDLLERHGPARVVVAGDLLHPFDRLPGPVAETLASFIDRIASAGASLVVTPGNHDPLLGPAAPEVPRTSAYRLVGHDVVVAHGHREVCRPADTYLVGHAHPSIVIEGRKRPCFLWGRVPGRDATVLALPAFNQLTRGVDVAAAPDLESPMLPRPGDCRPVVVDGATAAVHRFPRLDAFRAML